MEKKNGREREKVARERERERASAIVGREKEIVK